MNVTVLGGLGHIGLPLSIQLAKVGHNVEIIDLDDHKKELFRKNKADFVEEGIEEAIHDYKDRITISEDASPSNQYIILATNNEDILGMIEDVEKPFTKKWLVRQTVRPGEIKEINNKGFDVAFIPERLAQGKGLEEIKNMPQIVGHNGSVTTWADIKEIFSWAECIRVEPTEAVLAKLFCNYYRYGTFALANDMYKLADKFGANFNKIRDAIVKDYPRMSDFPKAGFAGGFCLPKDARYLEPYSNLAGEVDKVNQDEFLELIYTKINRELMKRKTETVGILGTSAKPNNDDIRSSVQSEFLPRLDERGVDYITHDEYLSSGTIAEVMECDVIVIMTPHDLYKYLDYSGKTVIDTWGVVNNE